MNYQKIHDFIIDRAKLRASNRKQANSILGYSERHHIIPKCLGGTNKKDNLVYLSAKEHFVIHQLLVKIYPNNCKLIRACNMLCVDKTGNRINNKRYEWIKKQNARVMSENRKGKNKNNNEGVRIAAEKRSGENHPLFKQTKYNNILVSNLAEINSNRTKQNDSGRISQAEKVSGENHWTKTNQESLKKLSDSKKGKTKHNDEGRKISAEKQTKINPHYRSLLVEKRNNGQSFKEIHEWLIKEGIDITLLTVRRTYNRETGTVLKRGGQKKNTSSGSVL